MHIGQQKLRLPNLHIFPGFGDFLGFYGGQTINRHPHAFGVPLHISQHRHFRIRAVYLRRDLDSRRSVIIQVKMGLRHDDQPYVAVDSAVKGKIRLLGIDGITWAVVHQHLNPVLLPQRLRNVHPESGVSSLMAAQLRTVH